MGNQKLSRAYFLKNVTLALKGEFMKIRKCHRYFSTLSPAFAPQAQKKKRVYIAAVQGITVLLFFIIVTGIYKCHALFY